ncbi:MAG TPA: alpha/beta hydrolase-fold protein [Bryobacteraceae bacterium]|nr:alpha/beta hydrolase-fold protein [Bryobacteraceae bacterium]
MRFFLLVLFAAAGCAADLNELARNPDALRAAVKADDLKKGTAWLGDHETVLFAIETEQTPALVIDDGPRTPMSRAAANLWMHVARLAPGRSHAFHYVVNGADFGGSLNVPVFLPDSYEQPGVPQGKISEKIVHASKIYPGMQSDYWIYVPAQYDPSKPAALMVWQDGQGHVARNSRRTQNVIDNLIHQKKIPVMIQVFISPGKVGERALRSIEYDTVNDTYARFLRDEVLAEVEAKYNLRKDAYSRAIAGESSGGICSFNAAWFHPELFSRVLSLIGSYTSIQWKPGEIDGGNVYPNKVRKEPKRNLRVWLEDGSEDLENNHGSWPLQNIQMANSLKFRDYDFHFSWGNHARSTAGGNAELPRSLAWLWRDYDAMKTEQKFEMDAAEKALPMFRVKIYNRD